MKRAKICLDNQDQPEFDELFVSDASVHVERMNERGFWIGVTGSDGRRFSINTGIADGKWFFSVEEDKKRGQFYSVQRPAGRLKRTPETR